jgi:hypothetical protein
LFTVPFLISAQELEEETSFYVEPSFSENNLSYQETATFVYSANGIYFYLDQLEWSLKTDEEKTEYKELLKDVSERFKQNRSKIVAVFGTEKTPGIDNDPNITILMYPMKDGASGYVRTIDQYEKIIAPMSNQKEMMYINSKEMESPFIDAFLIHEFTHLININNKGNQLDDTWLAELYSEYTASILEEDDTIYSYLDQRVRDFYSNYSDALLLWEGKLKDYGMVTILSRYIADNYGEKVLTDAMKSSKTGIESMNEALSRNGYEDDFEDLYRNFLIALAINNCTKSDKYCFKTTKLETLKVLPFNNFLPYTGEATISIGQSIYNYAPQWQKFSGGSGELDIDFDGGDDADFSVTYIAEKANGKMIVGDFELNEEKQGTLLLSNMGEEYSSVIIIPRVEDSEMDADSYKKFNYSIIANVIPQQEEQEEQIEEEQSTGLLETVFNITKPLNELSKQELLILIVKILLIKNGYEIN